MLRTDPLVELILGPGDAYPAPARRAPGPARTGTRAGAARGATLAVLVLTGVLFTIAYREIAAGAPETSRTRADLVTDVRQRRGEADDLQERADALRAEVERKAAAAPGGDGDAASARALAAAAGLGRVVGDGVVVRLTDGPPPVDPVTGKQKDDNPGAVLDRDLQDVVNALWRLGAEAVAVNGQRLAATTTIRAAGGAILVDFRPVTSPYEVVAVGPDDLAKRFDRSATARRFRRYVEAYRMRFSVSARDGLRLPAAPEPRLRYAHPSPGTPTGSAGPGRGPDPTRAPTSRSAPS